MKVGELFTEDLVVKSVECPVGLATSGDAQGGAVGG